MAPSPRVWRAINNFQKRRERLGLAALAPEDLATTFALPQPVAGSGFNDGQFYAPEGGAVGFAPHALMAAPALAPLRMPPAVGTRHVLVLLVDFPDAKGARAPQDFDKLLFGPGTQASPSLSSYYARASGGRLQVSGQVVGWLRMPKPMSWYTNKSSGTGAYPQNGQGLCEAALNAAVAAGVDFSAFERDGDGQLDGLIVVHAGSGAEDQPLAKRPDAIWSHKWFIPQPRTINGVHVWAYTVQPEDGKVGVFCHEFGHFLGLPDLYDTSGRSEGVGEWCVMGSGSWGGAGHRPVDFCAWSKLQLGWAQATPTSGVDVSSTIVPGSVVELKLSGAPKERFLLETRLASGVDYALPGEGLLVWHIDASRQDNSSPFRPMVGLAQADGAQGLQMGTNRGDAGDPFVGPNAVFNAASNPNSHTNPIGGGQASGVALTDIAFAAGKTTLRITAP